MPKVQGLPRRCAQERNKQTRPFGRLPTGKTCAERFTRIQVMSMVQTKFSTAVSLTQAQREWLKKQPNGSELIRKIIDSIIAIDNLTEKNFKVILLKTNLDRLKEKHNEIRWKKQELVLQNKDHFEGQWKEESFSEVTYRNYHINDMENPEPIDEDGKIVKRLLNEYSDAMLKINVEIERIKIELIG